MYIDKAPSEKERAFIQKITNPTKNIGVKVKNKMNKNTIDTGDVILTATMVSGIAHFATTIQPIISMCWGIVGILSGIFAIRYYITKSNK
jgi:hypothetical protein